MVPDALRPLYLEELRRLTADLNRTAQRIESILARLREGHETRDGGEPEVAASARLACPSNVVSLFPQASLHRDQPSDGESPNVSAQSGGHVR